MDKVGEGSSALSAGVHCLVSGLVQGVGFRFATMLEAKRLGLRGWVRNMEDGRVECEAFGDDKSIKLFCKWLEHGPRSARVSLVQVTAIEPRSSAAEFRIR